MSFHKMRRINQKLNKEEIESIFKRNTSGVLSVLDTDGYPYAVPLSYVYRDGCIYFHSAKQGHKIDAIHSYSKASFCIIDQDDVQPEKYTTFYKSVVAFGNIEIISNQEEVLFAIQRLGEKYYPNHLKELELEIQKNQSHFLILKFHIEHMTGKQAIELIKK